MRSEYKAEIIYGDTDSLMMRFPHIPRKELWEHCYFMEKELVDSRVFPYPMKFDFEQKIFAQFMILTKKKYMYKCLDRATDTIIPKIENKGVLLARRDNSEFIRRIYEKTVVDLFDKKPYENILFDIQQDVLNCFRRQFPQSDFIITKSVKDIAEYKVKELSDDPEKRQKRFDRLLCSADSYNLRCLPAHVQLATLIRSRGIRVDSGQRIEYVVVKTNGGTDLLADRIEASDYQQKFSAIVPIDYFYYIKALCVPLDQLLQVVFKSDKLFTAIFKYFLGYARVVDEIKKMGMGKINLIQ